MLFYRTDLLKQKGLAIPRNWDELLKVAKALTEGDRYGIVLCYGQSSCNSLLMSPMLWANGAQLFDKDWNVILDSPQIKPKAVEALNFFKELYKYMPPGLEQAAWAEMMNLFATGRVAIGTYPGRLVHLMAAKYPDLLDKFEVGGYPTKDGKNVSAGFANDGFVVLKGPNSKIAKEFLRWFAKNKMAEFDAILPVHYLPPQKSVFNDPRYRTEEAKRFWKVIQTQYDLIQTAKLGSIDIQGPSPDARPIMILDAGIIVNMIQSVLLLNTPAEKAVDQAADQIRDLMARKKK